MAENTSHPLTDKALKKLRALVEGNGLHPNKVELLGTEEKTLTVQAEMHLSFEIATQRQRYPGQPPATPTQYEVKVVNAADEIPKQIEEFKTGLAKEARWLEGVIEQLKSTPGQGFGLMRADITVENLARIFRVQEKCSSCSGSGSTGCEACRATGMIFCQQCQGSGLERCQYCMGRGTDANDPSRYCQMCNGSTQVQCRICYGRREITCTACNGQRKIMCRACGGDGNFTLEERALPTVRGDFKLMEGADLPSGLRRVFDRGGLKMLARGQAQIVMEPVREGENNTKVIPYSATFPFADARLRINGKPMRATIIGEKASIRDIPAFLDPVFDRELEAVGKKIGGSNALERALKLRAMRDMFGLMQQGGELEVPFRRLYPVGLSPEMIQRMQGVLNKATQEKTFLVRAAVSGFLLTLLGGIFYGIFASGVRVYLAQKLSPSAAFIFDAFVCGLAVLFVDFALRFSSAAYLRQLTQHHEKVSFRAQRSGSLGISVGICALFLYLALLWFLKATPGFFG
jgi:hypothetical protein